LTSSLSDRHRRRFRHHGLHVDISSALVFTKGTEASGEQ
jgi:hypothetical protein